MITSSTVPRFSAANLDAVPGLVHGFSTRHGGVSRVYRPESPPGGSDLNLGYSEHDRPEHVRTNRQLWLRALGVAEQPYRFALLRQEHGTVIHSVGPNTSTADFGQPGTLPGDGLVTSAPGVLLSIQTADCIPVLLCDLQTPAIGAFHAGWRGTLARIVQHGVDTMQRLYGSQPDAMLAAVGPGIGPRSFVVGSDVQQSFAEKFSDAERLISPAVDVGAPGGARYRLDLWEANRLQLIDAGLRERNVEVLAEDTATQTDRFFSYRGEAGRTGRMMASIALQAIG